MTCSKEAILVNEGRASGARPAAGGEAAVFGVIGSVYDFAAGGE